MTITVPSQYKSFPLYSLANNTKARIGGVKSEFYVYKFKAMQDSDPKASDL